MTTTVYMLGYRTRLISSIMSSIVGVLSATFTISHLAFHVVADIIDHLTCRLRTPRTVGQSSVRFIRCRGVRYWATQLPTVVSLVPATSDPRTADTLPSSNTDWGVSYISGHGVSVYHHCADCLPQSQISQLVVQHYQLTHSTLLGLRFPAAAG